MAARRKFTFDNPEDSYWNVNGPVTVSLFDDSPSTSSAAAARAALENLFENKVQCGSDDGLSNIEIESLIEKPTKNGGMAVKTVKSTAVSSRPSFQLGDDEPFRWKFSSKSAASVVSDGSAESFSSNATTQLDYSRLKSEHRKLQRHLEQIRFERYRPADPEITVRRLQCGESVALDLYRSKKEKLNLLDTALDSFDGNVVIAVVLALEKSLETSVFLEILKQKPVAAHHYVAYLKDTQQYDELTSTLSALNRLEEVALAMHAVACRKESAERIIYLKKCLNTCNKMSLESLSKSVNEHIDLLERQIAIEDADETAIKEKKNKVFQQYPKSVTLIGRPVLTTLYYACLYHFDLPMNSYASPLSIKQVFQMTEKQYAWMAVSALSRLKRWNDIEQVLTSKKLLGGVKIVCPFAWRHLFSLISANDEPPKDILCKLLRAVPDTAERHHLASQFASTSEVVVECLVAQKDRIALSALLTKLTPHTPETYKALSALNNAASRWKN